jgi:hypothetical protein
MPLSRGKSEKAFKQNVRTEMDAGKPQNQSLAIAYSMKRKKKKMAEGGQVTDNYQSPKSGPHQDVFHDVEHNEKDSGYMAHAGDERKRVDPAITEDDRELGQHGEFEEGPEGIWMADGGDTPASTEDNKTWLQNTSDSWAGLSGSTDADAERRRIESESGGMAHGGFIGSHQSEAHEEDMVGRIMKKREHMYSKGGRVANDTPITAGFQSNDFDDLAHRDDLEFSYTGANSGDELGNKQEDEDRHDIVARIMKKRARQHNPRPA